MTLPDRFIDQGSADEMYNAAGMSAAQISDRLQSLYLARQSQNPVDQTKQDVG
jgi:deoxyxylulose-5-phosphate synthase